MNPDKHQSLIDLLDKELAGSLTDGPSEAFNDPGAARERRILGVALEAIRFNAVSEEVNAVMQNIRKENAVEGQPIGAPVKALNHLIAGQPARGALVRRLGMSSRRIAAILVFAVCLGGAGKYLFTTPSGVFDTYYSSYTLGNTRGGEALSVLERAYQDKDWASVVHDFQFTRSKTGKDYFLTGMAYMEQKEYYEAIGLFKSLIATNAQMKEPYFEDEAEYYLAMSYLASHQTAAALVLLDKIKADPHHLFNKQVSAMSGTDLLILHGK